MSFIKLYNVVNSQSLVTSDTSTAAYVFPGIVQGDTTTIQFTALEPNGQGGIMSPWSRVAISSYSLKIGLFDTSGNQLAYQATWTSQSSTESYIGVLTQDSGKVTTAIGSITVGNYVTAYLQIVLTDSDGNITTGLPPTQVKLYKAGITTGATTVPVGEVSASQEWASSVFVKKAPSVQENIILRSPNGNQFLFYIDDQGIPHYDQIAN